MMMQFQRYRHACTIALVTLLLTASGAQAFEGRYETRDRSRTLIVKMLSPTTYKLELAMGTGRCLGNVAATATLSGDSLQTVRGRNDDTSEAPQTCRLSVTRTPGGMTVKEQSCPSFHGASCEFTGSYLKR